MAARRHRKKWSDLTSAQRAAVLVAGCLRVSLAAAAWADLARRPADQVEGGKGKWAAIIAINFVGPLAYFARGRKPVDLTSAALDSTPAEHSLEP
jgi:hypothetical protein